MASWGSDLPLRRRRWRLGRSTSTTLTPLGLEVAGEPGAIGTGPFDTDQLDRTEVSSASPAASCSPLGGGKALDAEESSSFIQSCSYMDVEVRIDAAGDASWQIGHCHPFVGFGLG